MVVFFNDPATTEIYPLSLRDAHPISLTKILVPIEDLYGIATQNIYFCTQTNGEAGAFLEVKSMIFYEKQDTIAGCLMQPEMFFIFSEEGPAKGGGGVGGRWSFKRIELWLINFFWLINNYFTVEKDPSTAAIMLLECFHPQHAEKNK